MESKNHARPKPIAPTGVVAHMNKMEARRVDKYHNGVTTVVVACRMTLEERDQFDEKIANSDAYDNRSEGLRYLLLTELLRKR